MQHQNDGQQAEHAVPRRDRNNQQRQTARIATAIQAY